MRCSLRIWLLLLLCIGQIACATSARCFPWPAHAEGDGGDAWEAYAPTGKTPGPLRELWLRFHESELCQDLDAVFVFHPRGLEVWCRVEDEKSFQKFSAMAEPLKKAYQIELYATRPSGKKQQDQAEPPPSLWGNSELLRYIGDPESRVSSVATFTPADSGDGATPPPHHLVVRQRLLIFAEQVSEWNKKMRRYGMDLPALAREGFGTDTPPDFKKRAASVCLAHARGVDRYSARLVENLTQALPRGTRREDAAENPKKIVKSNVPMEIAFQLRNASASVARRVSRFLHPQEHTVELSDLREPSLLESLRSLHAMVSGLQDAALRQQ